MRASEDLGDLATALAAAQGELENVSKGSEGYGYKYADLGAVLDAIRPHLSKHGIALIQMPGNGEHGGIRVTTRLVHTSGQWIEEDLEMPVEGGKNLSGAQAAGVVITYCRRYMASAFAGLAQEDPDAAKDGEVERKQIPKRGKPTGRQPQSVAQTTMDESIPNPDYAKAAEYVAGLSAAVFNEDKAGGLQLYREMDNDMKVTVWAKLDAPTRKQLGAWNKEDAA